MRSDQTVTVQENLSLTIEIARARTCASCPPVPPDTPHFDVDELFEDDSEERLKTLLDAFADLFGDGQDPSEYCESVGQYWTVMCTVTPGDCPEVVETLPDCG